MIKLKGIARSYQTGTGEIIALSDVNLELAPGEFVEITGNSGSGKTTLINILGLLDTPSRGSYKLYGRELVGASERELAKLRCGNIGIVFQGFNLLREYTIFENVEFPLLAAGMGTRRRRSRVREVLELVGLNALERCRPGVLSGGEQQRAAIARAVVGDPRMVLADEPTGNLDGEAELEVLDLLHTLSESGATVVMTRHSDSAVDFGGRQIVINGGICSS